MRKLFIAGLLAASLAVVGSAGAGGWATAGVAPPADVSAGETWNAEITVLQHGRTPLAGVKPTLTIRNAAGGETKTFAAEPTDRAGVYEAKVVFPSSGSWSYEVYDGFVQYGGADTHKFGAVEIGESSGGFSASMWLLPGGAALVSGAGLFLFRRRRRS